MGHFAGGELGHYRDLDIGEPGVGAFVGGCAGQAPGGALVVHQPARAVDGVEDDAERCGVFVSAGGEGAAGLGLDPFGDDDHRHRLGPFLAELFDHRFDEQVELVDGVGGGLVADGVQVGGGGLARLEDDIADAALQLAEVAEDCVGVGEHGPVLTRGGSK